MSRFFHFIYIGIFVAIVSIVLFTMTYQGISYYKVSLEERFYHPDNNRLKSSGYVGHSLGIIGSLCILIGVITYMVRKRYRSLSRFGQVKYWLEFHIFLCVLGTFMVVFHTAFKFGGLAAVSFWSMATVFISGIAGRVIYLQIPRTMEGRELDLKEVREMRSDIIAKISHSYNLDENSISFITFSIENRSGLDRGKKFLPPFNRYFENRKSVRAIRGLLRENKLSRSESSTVVALVKNDIRLGRTLERLEFLKNIFRYWHVFHLPFAVLMLIFMIVHVIVTVALGYRWIF